MGDATSSQYKQEVTILRADAVVAWSAGGVRGPNSSTAQRLDGIELFCKLSENSVSGTFPVPLPMTKPCA